jgi:hypothetical protein
LLGPYGTTLSYFSDEFLSKIPNGGIPLEENWFARENSNDFKNVANYNCKINLK